MKKWKRRVAALLLVCVITAMCTVSAAAYSFSDVPDSSPYWADVNYVSDNGLMIGSGNGTFDPDGITTRAMMVKVLYAHAHCPEISDPAPFSDVPAGEWYTAAISWAAENGIVYGVGGGLFAPDQAVTRQDAIAILARYAEYAGLNISDTRSLSAFSDYGDISGYALPAMEWAYASQLVFGTSSTAMSPMEPVTRSQLAALLTRYGTTLDPGPIGITVLMNGAWKLTNASGKTLQSDSFPLSGDMKIYSQGMSTEGYGPSTLSMDVSYSDAFEFIPLGSSVEAYCSFGVIAKSFYADAHGYGIDRIFVGGDGVIELTGVNMDYSISHKGSDPTVLLYTVSGSGASHVTLREDAEGQLLITGISGEYSVELCDCNGAVYQKFFVSPSAETQISITLEDMMPSLT